MSCYWLHHSACITMAFGRRSSDHVCRWEELQHRTSNAAAALPCVQTPHSYLTGNPLASMLTASNTFESRSILEPTPHLSEARRGNVVYLWLGFRARPSFS